MNKCIEIKILTFVMYMLTSHSNPQAFVPLHCVPLCLVGTGPHSNGWADQPCKDFCR